MQSAPLSVSLLRSASWWQALSSSVFAAISPIFADLVFLLPEEAINAATINSAYAMGLSRDYGSIAVGKVANFFITQPIPSVSFIPYAYTTPIVSRVFLKGKEVI